MPNLSLCHWSSQLFDLRAPSSTDVPVLLLNQPNETEAMLVFETSAVVACVQTSPISFVGRGKVPFLRATNEIGDVCTQASAVGVGKLNPSL